jgi:hypothetical protein
MLPNTAAKSHGKFGVGETMRITVMQVLRDQGDERATLGFLSFPPRASLAEDVLGGEDSVLLHQSEDSLVINAAYSLSNMNLSVAIRHRDVHIFTAACHWEAVAPYFAFTVPGGAFVELYFEKAPTAS